MKNIIVISGKMQSGKSSIAKYLYGYHMVQLGIIDRFAISEDGELLVPIRGKTSELGVLDIYRTDDEFINFVIGTGIASEIQRYSFADQLKSACAHIFGVDPELFKTDAGKNSPTHIKWANFIKLLD